MIKAYKFKLMLGQDTSQLITNTFLTIIGISNSNIRLDNSNSIISNTSEQKELLLINQQEELINQENPDGSQTYVHEFEGSTKLAEEGEDRHNHRFAGVTIQKIPHTGGHRHAILTNTDFLQNHHHEIGVISGPPIPVGNGKHVHFVGGISTIDDGHFHLFQLATLIESPLT